MEFHRDKVILTQDSVRTGNSSGPRHSREIEAQYVRTRGQVQKIPEMVAVQESGPPKASVGCQAGSHRQNRTCDQNSAKTPAPPN